MKKIVAICLILLLAVSPLSVFATEAVTDASVVSGCSTLDGQVPLLGNQLLVNNTSSAILYETGTDTLLYAYNADAQLPPASLLKILTALIAIEKGNMTDVVTVQAEVLNTLASDAVVVELLEDEVVTVQDLLYCMMVGSGNDAAVVLADHVLGSQEAFVAEMNRYALELGCTGTNFTNVHGLHDDQQYTTARDVARILAKAIQNEQFCEVFGANYYTVPATNKSEARNLVSQNYLMNNDKDINYFDSRATGSRTGVANDRSRCIASTAKVGEMNLICIVMGSKSVYADDGYTVRVYGGYDETTKLFDLGFKGYKAAQILHPGQVIQQLNVVNGSSDVTIGTRESATTVIPSNTDDNTLSYRYINETNLTAPIQEGDKVSTLQIWIGNVCVAQTDLFAMNTVLPSDNPFGSVDADGNGVGFGRILLYLVGTVLVIALILLICLIVLRAIRITKAKQQSRRNRRNRRRSR